MQRYEISLCDPDRVGWIDLRKQMRLAQSQGWQYETYQLTTVNDDGYRGIACGHVLWLPRLKRAGIAAGSDADWTDAESPEHAMELWCAGEMRN